MMLFSPLHSTPLFLSGTHMMGSSSNRGPELARMEQLGGLGAEQQILPESGSQDWNILHTVCKLENAKTFL